MTETARSRTTRSLRADSGGNVPAALRYPTTNSAAGFVRTEDAAAAAVVEERRHGFLEHALFVSDDDIRRVQIDELLEPVFPVDDTPIEIVQVRCREAARRPMERAGADRAE